MRFYWQSYKANIKYREKVIQSRVQYLYEDGRRLNRQTCELYRLLATGGAGYEGDVLLAVVIWRGTRSLGADGIPNRGWFCGSSRWIITDVNDQSMQPTTRYLMHADSNRGSCEEALRPKGNWVPSHYLHLFAQYALHAVCLIDGDCFRKCISI